MKRQARIIASTFRLVLNHVCGIAWIALLGFAIPSISHADAFDENAFFQEKCASCHGERRYGGYGPPLIPQTLGRKKDAELSSAMLEGLPNTQMAPFREVLSEDRAAALVQWIRQPLAEDLHWSMEDIAASRVEFNWQRWTALPFFERKNRTLVVERGTGSVSVLDGDSLEELDRYPAGRIHGGIKFDEQYRMATASTRDGTVVQYDLRRGVLRAKVKAGINTRNVAVAPSGRFTAVANLLPSNLVIFDADLQPLKTFPLSGQASAVYPLPRRNQFVLTLRDVPELYKVSYPSLRIETFTLPVPFEDISFVPGTTRLVASSRGGSQLFLYDWRTQKVLGTLSTQGLPHLFSVCFFERQGDMHAAFNHLGVPLLSIVNMRTFEVEKSLTLSGPGFFVRTHDASPFLWADTNTEEIQLIRKEDLEIVPEPLKPAPGKKSMHVEFTASGDRALVSVWDEDGAVVVYDSRTLGELDRLPYRMPVGKYNAYNKTRLFR